MIICRTPYRISFFGGGTDYPNWYRNHGGAVLAATIDKYCYLTCRYLPPFFEHRFRIVYRKIETCRTIDEIEHPVVRETLKRLRFCRGLELHHDGDLPARSGMGSSSAFTVGLVNTLDALRGDFRSKQELAEESIYIEQECVGDMVGCQDQVMAAFGGLRCVQFHPSGQISADTLAIPQARGEELQAHLMLFYTGISRTSSDVAKTYVPQLTTRCQQLTSMRRLVDEGIDTLLSGMDIRAFGELLDEGWQLKRSLSPNISNPHIDELYALAKVAGAIGGKLTGAGGGGFLLFFVPPEKQTAVKDALNGLIHVPFRFDNAGSRMIHHQPVEDFREAEKARERQEITAFQELKEVSMV